MTMKCTNGKQAHTHQTVTEARDCWKVVLPVRRPATHAPAPAPATEGMYQFNGEIYKVVKAVHGSGQLYAKILDVQSRQFLMARGMIHKLTQANRMTAEEAKAFGELYGICVRCAATLTDEESIARGMGPVCAGKI